MEIIQSIIGFFIAIGILVTFHEYGHFITARLFNVTVLNFSIGFGKSIYKYQPRSSNTEYSIGLIPLGGYVKFFGDSNSASQPVSLSKIDDKDHSKLLTTKPLYQRAIIVSAGPIANFILAIFIDLFKYLHIS